MTRNRQPLGPCKSWSYSRLSNADKCGWIIKLAVVDKAPVKEPDPDGPLARGNRVHKAAEDFVMGQRDDIAEELHYFEAELMALEKHYRAGKVRIEEEWAYNRDMEEVEWRADDAWLRLKLDVCYHLDAETIVVIDHKTGKKFGNEIKHAQQGQLYAGIVALRFPEVKRILVEFWYLDQDDLTKVSYTRRQGLIFLNGFLDRADKLTTTTQFVPKPNLHNCKYCDYGANKGTAVCEFDVY